MPACSRRACWIALLAGGVAAVLPFWLRGLYPRGASPTAYYFGVFAMSWDLLFGFAGEVNFGPTFLIGLGAYAAGAARTMPASAIAALSASAGQSRRWSAACCWRCRRCACAGPYFGLVTLVAVLLLQDAIVIFAGVTGGEIGMTVPDVLSIDAAVNYWYALGFLAVSRADPVRPVALGARPDPAGQRPGRDRGRGARLQRHQAQAGRVLHQRAVLRPGRRDADLLRGHRLGRHRGRHRRSPCRSSSPSCFGGRRTILGAVLGAIFLIVFDELLRPLGQLNTFVVSAIALAVILFFPDGVLGYALRRRSARE